jgi:hypothetical protein
MVHEFPALARSSMPPESSTSREELYMPVFFSALWFLFMIPAQ